MPFNTRNNPARPHIAILTQQKDKLDNQSIKLLCKELRDKGCEVTLIPFQDCRIMEGSGFIECPPYTEDADGNLTRTEGMPNIINPQKYDLVIKRTWGEARTEGLKYYTHFLAKGVNGLNEADAIKLSHSKIKLHEYFTEQGINIPITTIFTADTLSNIPTDRLLENIKNELGNMFIVKGETGTRGDNVRLIDLDKQGGANFRDFLKEYRKTHPNMGIVIQKYIQTRESKHESECLRVNIINGKIQSIAAFVDHYDETGKLIGNHHNDDRPIAPNHQLLTLLQPLTTDGLFKRGVWGIDVLRDIHSGEYKILEINDGPNISLINALAHRHPTSPESLMCGNFARQHATEALRQIGDAKRGIKL